MNLGCRELLFAEEQEAAAAAAVVAAVVAEVVAEVVIFCLSCVSLSVEV